MRKIAMVVGEDFWLRIPMNNESAGRHLCMDDVEVIHAWLESGYGGCWTLPLVTDGEQLEGVAVKVPGSRLGLGTYAVVMAGKFVNGDHFRTKRQLFIRLVDREDQADAKPTMFNEEKAYWAGPAVLSGMLSRDGLNTYELAVLHGFGGTLEEFLAQQGIELQDLMVTKAKLSREVQTQLDKGSEKAITPAGDYDDETKYSVNEMVYDEVTNSSYVSKQSENVGHAVTDTDWWMKVLDGNYVQTTIQAIMTAAQATLDEAKQDTLDATAAALAAKQATEQATAAANNVVAQKVAQAQVGYYTCTTAAGTATKATTSNLAGTDQYSPASGGAVKIKMSAANTSTDTVYLQFGSDTNTKKPLYYNGLAVDDSNTWEDNEVISVYFDPAANSNAGAYYASNAQGGGGKAEKIKYDNSQSGLSATDVQGGLDDIGNMFKCEVVSSYRTTSGTNLSTYTNRRIDVKAGFIRIEINGNVSKVSSLADDREYLRIQLYDTSNTLVKTVLSVTTTKTVTAAESNVAESTLTHLFIGTEILSDGYLIIGERTSLESYYELSVKSSEDTSHLVSVGDVNVIGTDSGTFVDSDPLAVSAGDNLKLVIDGNVSKVSALGDDKVYLRVRFTGVSGTVTDLYNACTTVPSSSPNDYAPILKRKVLDFVPSEDGTIIFQNRMSSGSSFVAKALIDVSSKFVKVEDTFNDKFDTTLVINNDAVLRRGGTKGRALLNLGCIHGHVAWDITLDNDEYQYVVRLYSYDVGYYYPSSPDYDSGWLSGHSTSELSDESYQYFLLAIGRTDNEVLTSEDLASIQEALSGTIKYNNLSHLAKEPQKKNIISNRHLQVCAHRGFHLNDVPENSVDSVRFAAMMGFDMVETDFSQTSDGELVLMHDDSINRTMVNADGSAISSTVKMIDKTLTELRSSYVLKSEDARMMKPIPTLEEYFLACKKYGIFPVPEIKTWGNSNEAVLKAYEMGCEIMGKDNFAFISFGYEYLDYARTLSPNLLLGYIGESILNTVNTVTGESRETPFTIWSPKYDNTHGVSEALIKQYHEKGMKVQVWTPPVAEYPYINQLGADIVTTNDISPNIGNAVGYVFDSYANWNDFITDGVFDEQTLILDTSEQLLCNLKETIVNGKFALEINFTGSISVVAPNLNTTVTSSDADETYIYQGLIDYKNPSLLITAAAASKITLIRYYIVPVNQ